MVQYARVEIKTAYMSGDFAVSYATRLFGAEAVAALPLISRGKRKGQIKGVLTWRKATTGGWHRDGDRAGVVFPGFVGANITIDGVTVLTTTYPTHEKKLAAEAADAADRARYQAEQDAERAEYLAELAVTDPDAFAAYNARRAARLAKQETPA